MPNILEMLLEMDANAAVERAISFGQALEWLKSHSDPKLWAHVKPHLEGYEVYRATPFLYAFATPTKNRVIIPPVVGPITLVTAFHEIGHMKTWKAGITDEVGHEDAASEWAKINCPLWTRQAQNYVRQCQRSYKYKGEPAGLKAEHEYMSIFAKELNDAGFSREEIGFG